MKTMKSHKKLFFTAHLFLMILFCFSPLTVHAKNLGNSKGITWDLRPGKTLTYKSYLGGVGLVKQKVSMTNYSDQASSRSGYRILKFRLNYNRKMSLTASQVANASTYYYVYHPDMTEGPRCFFAIVDYDTGKSLQASNKFGVTVSRKWYKGTTYTYRTSGYSYELSNTYVDVVVNYPVSYQRMCIGAGGWSSATKTTADENFWNGKIAYWKTNLYQSKKTKLLAHFTGYRYVG